MLTNLAKFDMAKNWQILQRFSNEKCSLENFCHFSFSQCLFSYIFSPRRIPRERIPRERIRFQNGAKECILQISARAFQRIFASKIWLRYSRERASQPASRERALQSQIVRQLSQTQFRTPRSRSRRRGAGAGGWTAACGRTTPAAWELPWTRRVVANFWHIFGQNFARFRQYRHRSLQVNTRFSAFFKIYQIIQLKKLKIGKLLQILQHVQNFG